MSEPIDYVRSETARREAGSEQLAPVAEAVRAFAVDLYRRIAGSDGNVVCSPYSVAVALAMARVGARGQTATEMGAVLGAIEQDDFDDGMNALSARIEALGGFYRDDEGERVEVAVDTANALWGQRGEPWRQPFIDTLAREYGAGLRAVDYAGHAEAAREQINAWTADRTRGRIPEIVPTRVLDAMTRLALVNAIYFKAPWASPFTEDLTTPRAFTRSDGTRLSTATMHDTLSTGYAQTDDCQILRLDYAGGGSAMSVLLPGGDLSAFEASLSGARLGDRLAATSPETVEVFLPRWSFQRSSALNEALVAMGMPTAFDPTRADFGGMTDAERLAISAVLHDAFIAVDEHGTEAAAATAVVMRVTGVMTPTAAFVADRPFLFAVHDIETMTPLFIGRVDDPTA